MPGWDIFPHLETQIKSLKMSQLRWSVTTACSGPDMLASGL